MKYIVESKAIRHVLYSISDLLRYLAELGFKPSREVIECVGSAPWMCRTKDGEVTVRRA